MARPTGARADAVDFENLRHSAAFARDRLISLCELAGYLLGFDRFDPSRAVNVVAILESCLVATAEPCSFRRIEVPK